VRLCLISGAVFGLLAVALGAFGAHALKERISSEMLTVFQTGVHYQAIHALALLILAALSETIHVKHIAWLFIAGVIVFSGSLYAYALTGTTGFAMVTPIGGLCFLSGWLTLLAHSWRIQRN